MKYLPKENYLIICEGNSEFAYIQELNRYLNENDYPFTFIAKPVYTGHFNATINMYKKIKNENKKFNNIKIWVDKDTYIRNDNGDKKRYDNKQKYVPDFYFNLNNFEDFLVMHLSKNMVEQWQEICRKKNHFEKPLFAEEYLPLYRKNIFPKYEKSNIPFTITKENINQALNNQKNSDILFKSGFLELLIQLFQNLKNNA